MGDRIRRMAASEVENLLSQHGFVMISQRGSHRKWRHSELGLQVIVPYHGGNDLPLGTLRAIMVNAKVPPEKWHH
jgi:predicted RNA binding protein YcfA (HicA-like mRNA interferase family)